ncbi:hypothetical protein [Abyssisolibacter fermentans]|nr:hypothetical protein [Abyssisolibacter fermentans]
MKKLKKKINTNSIAIFKLACEYCYVDPEGSTDYSARHHRYDDDPLPL